MRNCLIAFLLCLFCSTADAAITLDASVQFDGSSGTSQTKSLTVASDANGLVVMINSWECAGGDSTISSVTYNGTGLTLAKDAHYDGGGCGNHAAIYYLASPSTGTHDVVVTFNESQGGIYGASASLKGFKQTAQPDATADGSGSWFGVPTENSENISVVASNSWIFDVVAASGGTVSTPGSGQTALQSSICSYKPDVSSGTNSMGWMFNGSNYVDHAIASFAPAPSSRRRIGQVV